MGAFLISEGFPGGLDGKESACNVEDPGSIPGSGRSLGEGNGNPLQYSHLENPMRSLVGYSPRGCKESDMTERLYFTFIDAFKLWCWRRLLRVPWTARRSNQPILKESSPEYSLEGLMLKLSWPRLVIAFLPRSKNLLISWLQSPSTVILEPP